ncbi:MAG: hypothetical protein Q9170_006478 [Blastenia crenularia]
MAKPTGQKRQAAQAGIDNEENSKRTKRATSSYDQSTSSPSEVSKGNGYGDTPAKKGPAKETSADQNGKKKIVKKGIARKVVTPKKTASTHTTKSKPRTTRNSAETKPKTKSAERRSSSFSEVAIPVREKFDAAFNDEASEEDDSIGPSYWLMKAEPESRIQKGTDVKFSIDDLKSATEPEAWEGVRNATARNNMRAMMTGDMAFFYHSNCKKPGIVGTMEIVREHSVDASAFIPEHPYYDEKSSPEKPKWFVVHVEFRRKFPEMVSLKELQKYAKPGGVLENMYAIFSAFRSYSVKLSVSKVKKKEWKFIHTLMETDEAAASAAYEPEMKR